MSTATSHAPGMETPGRDANGRFAKGNPGGPGNPYARQVAALRQTVADFLTPKRMEDLLQAIFAKAVQGDLAAAKLLLSYGVGKPAPAVDPDRVDAHEWQVQTETATMLQEMPALLQAPAPSLPLAAVRTTRPAVAQELARKLGAMLADPDPYQDPGVELVEGDEDDGPSPNGGNGGPPSPSGDDGAWRSILAARQGMTAPSPNGRAVAK